jgi:hypothetical protein
MILLRLPGCWGIECGPSDERGSSRGTQAVIHGPTVPVRLNSGENCVVSCDCKDAHSSACAPRTYWHNEAW